MLYDTTIKDAKPGEKPVKLFDERGLYLLVTPTGSRLWRFKYRFDGKEKLLALGSYPDVSLADARKRREEARQLVAAGVDPAAKRRSERQTADTFEGVAREWVTKFEPSWSEKHAETVLSRLERDLFPQIGGTPVGKLSAHDLLRALRKVEARGSVETARRERQIAGQVLRFAVATGRADRDVSADLAGALAPVIVEHRAAILDPGKLGGLLRAIDGCDAGPIVKAALQLLPLLFVRPGELRCAEWQEINLDSAQWIIPAWKAKMRKPLVVPLCARAVTILRALHPITGAGRYTFPSLRTCERPMSDGTLSAALRRLGYSGEEVTPHGFRATARTLLDEVLGERAEIVELQLGHSVRDPLGLAYGRMTWLKERGEMMTRWSDYLEKLRAGASAAAKQA